MVEINPLGHFFEFLQYQTQLSVTSLELLAYIFFSFIRDAGPSSRSTTRSFVSFRSRIKLHIKEEMHPGPFYSPSFFILHLELIKFISHV